MGLFRGRETPRVRQPSFITAAGKPIDLSKRQEIKGLAERPLPWQRAAYSFYDPGSPMAVGEAWFAGRYVAENMSRLRMFAAIIIDPAKPPVSIDSPEVEDAGIILSAADIALAKANVARLTNSQGGVPDILRGLALNNFLAGESFLVGRTGDDGSEEWEAHSIEAIVPEDSANEATARLLEYPGQPAAEGIDLADATVVRIWRKHPRWPQWPDAAMGAAITYLEDLWTLTQMVRAAARSRIPAGMLVVAQDDEIQAPGPGGDNPEQDEDGDAAPSKLAQDLLRHLSTPLSSPGDAASLVPFLYETHPDLVEKIKHIDLGRDIDAQAIELREEARRSFAATIDLPPDVITGKQGLNDWSAFNVDQETWRVHLATHAELLMSGITAGYYRPAMGAVEDPRIHCIWYDASDIVVDPGEVDRTKDAHDMLLISDEAGRRGLRFSPGDAPDAEEYARRASLKRPQSSSTSAGTVEAGEPDPGGPDVQASARPIRSLGYRLAAIERELITRLVTAADAELRTALTKAGNRLVASGRKRTARNGEAVRAIIASAAPMEVAAKLGPELVAALGFTPDALLNGAIDSLEPRWDQWVAQAQRQALRYIEAEGDPFSDEAREQIDTAMRRDREAGWAVFAGALAATATAALFRTEQPRSLGEHDSSVLVPASAVRGALSTAGGGPTVGTATSVADSGEGRGGLLSGQNIREAFQAAALQELGWVWVYGDPSSRSHPLPVHEALDGESFDSWESPVLQNPDAFPEVEFLYPGDHDGCQCTFARDAARITTDDDEEA